MNIHDKKTPIPHGPVWYAVHTRPWLESVAAKLLRWQGYKAVYLFVRKKKRCGPKKELKEFDAPYFSRYIFVGLQHWGDTLYAVNNCIGVSTVVYCGDEPLVIPNDVMQEIMGRANMDEESDDYGLIPTDDRGKPQTFPGLPGDRFKFPADNPFGGLVAEISRIDKTGEIIARLSMLGSERELRVSPQAIGEIIRESS